MKKSKKNKHEEERKKDTSKILDSDSAKRVVVAGPGTGKSFLFQEAIKREKLKGNKNFLALTFVGKLCDELADDLAGLAKTKTLHGFARDLVLSNLSDDWEFYPEIFDLIKHDLSLISVTDFEIGDTKYKERTEYYKAVGNEDVMHYAVEICKREPTKIPRYDMILVDEYQDFSEKEAELIDFLAKENKILIVGDDDQALYGFRGSFSKYIRSKFHSSNVEFESHTLKYCSRCTEVIIDVFDNIVKHFKLNKDESKRIAKKYLCYTPDKKGHSELNQKILVMEDVSDGMVAFKIQKELNDILKTQNIKSVLIIGEAQSCQATLALTARLLSEYGFKKVQHKSNQKKIYAFKKYLVQGYKILSKNENNILAWRLIIEDFNEELKNKLILENYEDKNSFVDAVPQEFKKKAISDAKVLNRILAKPKSNRNKIANSSIERLEKALRVNKKEYKDIFIDQLVQDSKFLPRPLVNLDINVSSILGAKGLGADVVFLIGFDQGRLPVKSKIKDSEIYQFLVALTRAKKRIYLINTKDKPMSKFLECIDSNNYQKM